MGRSKTKSSTTVTFAVSQGVWQSAAEQRVVASRQQEVAADAISAALRRAGKVQGTVEEGYDVPDKEYPNSVKKPRQPRYVATGRINARDGNIGERTPLSDAWDLHLCTVPAFCRAGVVLMDKLGRKSFIARARRGDDKGAGDDAGAGKRLASSLMVSLFDSLSFHGMVEPPVVGANDTGRSARQVYTG